MCVYIYIHYISTYFLIIGLFSRVVLAPSVDFIALCYVQRVPTPWRTQPMGKAQGSRWLGKFLGYSWDRSVRSVTFFAGFKRTIFMGIWPGFNRMSTFWDLGSRVYTSHQLRLGSSRNTVVTGANTVTTLAIYLERIEIECQKFLNFGEIYQFPSRYHLRDTVKKCQDWMEPSYPSMASNLFQRS